MPRAGVVAGEAIRQIRRSYAVPIVAEIPQAPLQASREMWSLSGEALIKKISVSLHYQVVSRPSSIALLNRYLSYAEAPDLEVPELVAATKDIQQLFGPLSADWDSLQETRDHNQFFASLSEEQKNAMRGKGLLIAQLSNDQQALWTRINNANSFGHEQLSTGKLHRLLSGWARSELAYLTRAVRRRGGSVDVQTSLYFHCPGVGPNAEGERLMMQLAAGTSGQTASVPGVSVLALPKPRPFPPALARRVRIPEGETTLGRLIDDLGRAIGRSIEVPKYARSRKLFASVDGALAGNVVTALEDLYGWSFRVDGSRYQLGRPRLGKPRDLSELHAAVRAAIPPAIRLALSPEADPTRNDREHRQRALVFEEVARIKGKDWRQCSVADLSTASQQRLANYLFAALLRTSCAALPSLQATTTQPERGYFVIEGKEPHPLLTFRVRRADGQIDLWGWSVGSSTRLK